MSFQMADIFIHKALSCINQTRSVLNKFIKEMDNNHATITSCYDTSKLIRELGLTTDEHDLVSTDEFAELKKHMMDNIFLDFCKKIYSELVYKTIIHTNYMEKCTISSPKVLQAQAIIAQLFFCTFILDHFLQPTMILVKTHMGIGIYNYLDNYMSLPMLQLLKLLEAELENVEKTMTQEELRVLKFCANKVCMDVMRRMLVGAFFCSRPDKKNTQIVEKIKEVGVYLNIPSEKQKDDTSFNMYTACESQNEIASSGFAPCEHLIETKKSKVCQTTQVSVPKPKKVKTQSFENVDFFKGLL